MLAKLAFRNIKRQTSSYIIYFITVVFTVALMFAANNVLFSDELWAYNARMEKGEFTAMFAVIIAFVTLVVGFIICYATLFLLRKRKKEFGTYLLLGIKRSAILGIFMIENLVIGVVSFLIGCVLGIGVFKGLDAMICGIIGNNLRNLSLMPGSILVTVLQWVGIFIVSLFFSALILSKTKIKDLIKGQTVEKKLPALPLLETIIAFVMLGAIVASSAVIVFAVYGVCKHSLYSFAFIAIPVAASVLIVAIFFFYLCLRSIYFRKLKYRKVKINTESQNFSVPTDAVASETAAPSDRIKSGRKKTRNIVCIQYAGKAFTGSNIFHYRQMSSAMNRNAAIMGFIAVLLSLAVIFTNLTFSMRFIMIENIDMPFDIVGQWNDHTHPAALGSPEEVLSEAQEYSEISFSHIFEVYKTDKTATKELKNFHVISISDYNTVANAIDKTEYEVGNGEFKMILFQNSRNILNLEPGDTFELYGNELVFGGEAEGDNEWAYSVIDYNDLILVPDNLLTTEVCAECLDQRNIAMNTKDYLPPAFHEKYVAHDYMNLLTIDSRYFQIDEINVQMSVAIVSAIFIGMTFMLIAMALLSLKVMADVDLDKRRYAILNMLGVNVGGQRKIMLRQLLTFFAAPLLIPLLMVIPSIITGAFISSFFLGYVHGAIYGIGFAVPLVYLGIYLCYFAATYYLSVKNCVRPMEKARLKLLAG